MNTCKWKEAIQFPNEYLVSEDGKVFSKRNRKILKPATDKYGYFYYVLCVKGKRKTVKAHRLVAETFIPNQNNKPAVDHIDGNKTNNAVSNLRWVTNKENTHNPATMPNLIKAAKKKIPIMYQKSKEKNFGRKCVRIIYQDGTVSIFPSVKTASEATGKNYTKLSMILNGKRKQDKRFIAIWNHGYVEDEAKEKDDI
jgi:hypothetical protein